MIRTFTATPKDVERAFAAVFPHTGNERHIPVTTVVHVELEGTSLRLVATDRYTLAAYRVDLLEWAGDESADVVPFREPLEVNLYAGDLRRLFAFARQAKKDRARWSVSADRLSVELGDDTSLSIRTVDLEFVAYRKVFEQLALRPAEPTSYLCVAPDKLARFAASAAALGTLEPLVVWAPASPLKPIAVTIGASFAAALMPVRTDEKPTLDLSPFANALTAGGAQ